MLSLNIPPQKLFRWLRRPPLWATGDWQLHHWQCAYSCITSYTEFCGKTSNHPGDSAPLQPRFGALWLLAFPQTKIIFERAEISDYRWDSGKYDGAADGNWKNCERSQGAYFEGDWGIIVLCTMFLVSCIFFNEWLYFSNHMAGYLLDRPSYIHIFFFYDFLIEFIHVVACIDSLFLLRRNILLYECIIIYYLAGNRFWFLLNLGLRWVRLLGTFEDEYMWGPIFISFG